MSAFYVNSPFAMINCLRLTLHLLVILHVDEGGQ